MTVCLWLCFCSQFAPTWPHRVSTRCRMQRVYWLVESTCVSVPGVISAMPIICDDRGSMRPPTLVKVSTSPSVSCLSFDSTTDCREFVQKVPKTPDPSHSFFSSFHYPLFSSSNPLLFSVYKRMCTPPFESLIILYGWLLKESK